MKILSIGTDRNLLVQNSAVFERIKEIGGLVDELHVVLLSDKKHNIQNKKISENIWVYPTNSPNKFLRVFDAVEIGRRIKTDLITAQDPFECGWVGLRLKRILNKPLEVQLHTDMFSPNFNGVFNMFRKLLAKYVLPNSDGVRVVTEGLKNNILDRKLNKNVYVLPIYIDKSRIESEVKFDLHNKYGFENVLLTVSRLSKEKNIKLAIDVLSDIIKTNPKTGLVIVGSGPEEKSLRAYAGGLNLAQNVIFAGWQEDLASYYKTADVYLQTSKFEGYGLSLVEAGLSGLPVVSTPVGLANDLKNIGLGDKAQALASFVNDLLKDKSKRVFAGLNLKKELESIIFSKEKYLSNLRENWLNLTK